MSDDERAGVAVGAVARLQAFLRNSVEVPLADGLAASDPAELRSGVERALSAIQGLHFLADKEAGERTLRDLDDLVSRGVLRYVEGFGLEVDVVPSGESVQVRVDPHGFGDALHHILHNAQGFGGGTPVRVTVRTGSPYATVTIEDQGPGFSAEALSRAYDPFYSTTEAGLGLGLPQARHLIQTMGGEIHLKNGESGGIVEISLPLA